MSLTTSPTLVGRCFSSIGFDLPYPYLSMVTVCSFIQGVQRHPVEAKCVTKILGDKNKEVGGKVYCRNLVS